MSETRPLAIRLVREDALHDYQDAYAVGWSRYKKALATVEAVDPERLNATRGQNPLTLMDEEVVELVHEAWEAGVYVGDAFAQAEQVLDVERRVCQRCNGHGLDRRASDYPYDPCAVCGGEGTVPAGDDD